MKRPKLKYRATTPSALINFTEATLDLKLLLEAHAELLISESDTNEAKDKDTVFLRSACLLLSSAWEKFIEDIILESIYFMVNNIDVSKLPVSLKKQIALCIKKDKNELSPWNLSGELWKTKIVEYVKDQINKLNTPKINNIKVIFNKLFDLDITTFWKWEYEVEPLSIASFTFDTISKLIDDFISFRGGIAHGNPSEFNSIMYILYLKNIIQKISSITYNKLADYLFEKTGLEPWEKIKYNPDWKPFLEKIE